MKLTKEKKKKILIAGGLVGLFLLLRSAAAKADPLYISKNFTVEDVMVSETALHHGIAEQFDPANHNLDNARIYAAEVLEPLKRSLPSRGNLVIESWSRIPWTNAQAGGVTGSKHLEAFATDIKFFLDNQLRNDMLLRHIYDTDIDYRHLILSGSPYDPSYVHISYDPNELVKRVFFKEGPNDYVELNMESIQNTLMNL